MNRVFVVRLSAIGDTVMATRAVASLVNAGCDPIFVVGEMCLDVAASVVGLNGIVCIQKDGACRYLKRVKNGEGRDSFEIANLEDLQNAKLDFIDLHVTARSKRTISNLKKVLQPKNSKIWTVAKRTFFRIVLVWLARFAFRQKVRNQSLDPQAVKKIYEHHQELISFYLEKSGNPKTNIFQVSNFLAISEREIEKYELKREDFVLIAPGASAVLKAWPKENLRRFIQIVLERTAHKIVLCGGKDEEAVGQFLSFDSKDRILNLVGQTSLAEMLSLTKQAKFVLSADSFVAHMADVFSTPCAMLFGATSPRFGFVPISQNAKVFYQNLNCSPCTRHGKGHCRFRNLKCLKSISPEEVAEYFLSREIP